jgi:hypothetical protein
MKRRGPVKWHDARCPSCEQDGRCGCGIGTWHVRTSDCRQCRQTCARCEGHYGGANLAAHLREKLARGVLAERVTERGVPIAPSTHIICPSCCDELVRLQSSAGPRSPLLHVATPAPTKPARRTHVLSDYFAQPKLDEWGSNP